jgi:hypothetical protein
MIYDFWKAKKKYVKIRGIIGNYFRNICIYQKKAVILSSI